MDFNKPIKNKDLNRMRNIICALDNLAVQIDKPTIPFEKSLLRDISLLRNVYIVKLNKELKEK